MSLTVETAGIRIANNLDDAERAANEALRSKARLLESMMTTRLETELPQYQGHLAVMRLQKAISDDVSSMGELAKAHKSMRDDFTRITAIPDIPALARQKISSGRGEKARVIV